MCLKIDFCRVMLCISAAYAMSSTSCSDCFFRCTHFTSCYTVDPDMFVAINVCKFEFKINFASEKCAFLKY